jgi:hypothetical protein
MNFNGEMEGRGRNEIERLTGGAVTEREEAIRVGQSYGDDCVERRGQTGILRNLVARRDNSRLTLAVYPEMIDDAIHPFTNGCSTGGIQRVAGIHGINFILIIIAVVTKISIVVIGGKIIAALINFQFLLRHHDG